MIRYIFILLIVLTSSFAFSEDRINDLLRPGEGNSLVFGRVLHENRGEGKRVEIAIREYISDFEIRVPLNKGLFSAHLPKGIYRIASVKHDQISDKLSFLKAKKLKDCIFIVSEPEKVYYIGDIKLDLASYKKKRVKESKGLPLKDFVYTYHIAYSVEDNFKDAKEEFKARNKVDSEIEKSIINEDIDPQKLIFLRNSDPRKRNYNIDKAIKDALIKKDTYYFIFRFGGYFGGDRLASINSESVRAGDGAEISLGVYFKPFENRAHETQFTIGSLDTRTPDFDNYYEFERYTFEVMEYYRFRYFRLGAGVTYHMNPVLRGRGTVSGVRQEFDDSIGFVAEADAFLGYKDFAEIFLGIRYISINYENESNKYDGDSLGLVLGFYF